MLTDFVFPTLWNLGLEPATLHFQQDGATAHTARQLMNLLRTVLQHRIISRFGNINWPSCSPDLSPCDFYLWGFVKSKVFETRPADLNALKQRIVEEVSARPANTPFRIMKSIVTGVCDCINVNWRHLSEVIFKKWHVCGFVVIILVIHWFHNKWHIFLLNFWLFWYKFIGKQIYREILRMVGERWDTL
jgi:hypothetical protein